MYKILKDMVGKLKFMRKANSNPELEAEFFDFRWMLVNQPE